MTTDIHLQFLQQKIMEIRSALFFSMNNAVLKFPTSLITAFKVDDLGCIWFFANKPQQHIQEFDRTFPARLDFFKKGVDQQLRISGKAYIITDPEELNSLINVCDEIKMKAMNELILIKVKVINVECFEIRRETNESWLQGISTRLYRMLFQPPQQAFNTMNTAQY
jgi:general stress protein 26